MRENGARKHDLQRPICRILIYLLLLVYLYLRLTYDRKNSCIFAVVFVLICARCANRAANPTA